MTPQSQRSITSPIPNTCTTLISKMITQSSFYINVISNIPKKHFTFCVNDAVFFSNITSYENELPMVFSVPSLHLNQILWPTCNSLFDMSKQSCTWNCHAHYPKLRHLKLHLRCHTQSFSFYSIHIKFELPSRHDTSLASKPLHALLIPKIWAL